MADHSPTRPPIIMVSSTFYDLRQIREDLRRFIEDDLGYRALLSEHPSFPVNPDLTTVENCRERVQRDADVLVLVIGSRYGSVDDESAKSITNLEYLTARQKGIPIFAFVDHGIVPLLPVWKANPRADFTNQVDSPKLLEFVHGLHSVDRVWMQEFRHAQDIIDALRIQFAYQHQRGLALASQLRAQPSAPWLQELHGEALRIALERPEAWEYRLFLSALDAAVKRHFRARGRHRIGVALGLGEDVADPLPWVMFRLNEASRLLAAVNKLFGEALPAALGPTGSPGDSEAIILVADAVGTLYGDALDWHNRVIRANLSEAFHPLQSIVAKMQDDFILRVERFGGENLEVLSEALRDHVPNGPARTVNMTLTVKFPDGLAELLDAEIQRLSSELG